MRFFGIGLSLLISTLLISQGSFAQEAKGTIDVKEIANSKVEYSFTFENLQNQNQAEQIVALFESKQGVKNCEIKYTTGQAKLVTCDDLTEKDIREIIKFSGYPIKLANRPTPSKSEPDVH